MILAKETFLKAALNGVFVGRSVAYVFIFFGILSHIVRASTGYYFFMILVFAFTGLVFVCIFALFYKNVVFGHETTVERAECNNHHRCESMLLGN